MIEMMIGMALAKDNLRHHPRFPKKLQERVVVEVAVDKDSDDVTETRLMPRVSWCSYSSNLLERELIIG